MARKVNLLSCSILEMRLVVLQPSDLTERSLNFLLLETRCLLNDPIARTMEGLI